MDGKELSAAIRANGYSSKKKGVRIDVQLAAPGGKDQPEQSESSIGARFGWLLAGWAQV